MKKIIVLCLVATLTIFSACGKSTTSKPLSNNKETNKESIEQTKEKDTTSNSSNSETISFFDKNTSISNLPVLEKKAETTCEDYIVTNTKAGKYNREGKDILILKYNPLDYERYIPDGVFFMLENPNTYTYNFEGNRLEFRYSDKQDGDYGIFYFDFDTEDESTYSSEIAIRKSDIPVKQYATEYGALISIYETTKEDGKIYQKILFQFPFGDEQIYQSTTEFYDTREEVDIATQKYLDLASCIDLQLQTHLYDKSDKDSGIVRLLSNDNRIIEVNFYRALSDYANIGHFIDKEYDDIVYNVNNDFSRQNRGLGAPKKKMLQKDIVDESTKEMVSIALNYDEDKHTEQEMQNILDKVTVKIMEITLN